MRETQALMTEVYAAFNRRDMDGALALMRDDVDWPKASEGGRVRGKEEIRAYWTRQWEEFDPAVEPVAITEREAGRIEVKVHQVVKDLGGAVLSDGFVWHIYTLADGLIARMDVREGEAAFRR